MDKIKKPSILFVCTANIIRSPMAEVMLKTRLGRNPVFRGWQVNSAGIYGLIGEAADPQAQLSLRERGYDLSQHIGRRINEGLLSESDLTLTMEKDQRDILWTAFPGLKKKVYFLGDVSGTELDIADPRGRPITEYNLAADEIQRLLNRGFLWVIVLALLRSLGDAAEVKISYPQGFDVEPQQARQEALLVPILRELNGRPVNIRYEVLRLLIQLFPQVDTVQKEIATVSRQTPPTQEEEIWLSEVRLQEIVLPITCLKTIHEKRFRHPQIQDRLEQIRQRLEKPDLQPLFKDLELLYARKLPSFKYRLGIWDLTTKYTHMPYRVGDYEEAYRILRSRYP